MDKGDKIIELFSERKHDVNSEKIKYFHNFNYVRLGKDRNGNTFNAKHLMHYADRICYLVTVMREHDNTTWLYNYEVPSDRLCEFILKFKTQEFDGQIIDIDKYIPDTLA